MMNTNTNTIITNSTEKTTLPTFSTPSSEDFGDIPMTKYGEIKEVYDEIDRLIKKLF